MVILKGGGGVIADLNRTIMLILGYHAITDFHFDEN